jgi:hypothetical protein
MFTPQRQPTTSSLVPASQPGDHNRAQRPAIGSVALQLSQVLRETIQQIVFFDDIVAFRSVRGKGSLLITFSKGKQPTVEFSRTGRAMQ